MAESAGSVGTRVVLDPRVLAVARSSTVVVRVAASSQPPGDDRPARLLAATGSAARPAWSAAASPGASPPGPNHPFCSEATTDADD